MTPDTSPNSDPLLRAAEMLDLSEAQRELDVACQEVGATIGCIRAPGGISAEALRAIAKTVRESARSSQVPSKPSLAVRLVDGDILSMEADAIVNPWNRNYLPRWVLAPGGLSGKLKERTTDAPWRQLAKFGILPTGDVVVTDTGGLPGYGLMFHAIGLTFRWRATPEGVAECARNIVHQAIERGIRTVTVPLIGTGSGRLAPTASEAAILSGLSDVAHIVDDCEPADIDITIVRYSTGGRTER